MCQDGSGAVLGQIPFEISSAQSDQKLGPSLFNLYLIPEIDLAHDRSRHLGLFLVYI